jgi:hypothetical protein
MAEAGSRPALIPLFGEEVFSRWLQKAGPERFRSRYKADANESGPGKYSGFWLTVRRGEHTFFPPSPPKDRRLALGKSYPVTAAQLLPIHTGFLAPILMI